MNSTIKPSARVVAVCTSQFKHVKKQNIEKGVLMENYGFKGDAHADAKTHRQVSLLAVESIQKMRDLGLNVHPGDFAENITTCGINLTSLEIGSRLSAGSGILEVTQIGKVCHNPCAIGKLVGDCIMPKEGIFCRVKTGGEVKVGDEVRVIHLDPGRG